MEQRDKLIFLDFDGVLNSESFFIKQGKSKPFHQIDEKPVSLIVKLCEETGAKIVITSSWRLYDLESTVENFIYCEDSEQLSRLLPFMVGVTKRLDFLPRCRRGEEIKTFLRGQNIEKCVIIDDEDFDILNWQKSDLVKTDEKVGFTEKDFNKAKEILER